MKKSVLSSAAIVLLLAPALRAETAYVPPAPLAESEAASFTSEVQVRNVSSRAQALVALERDGSRQTARSRISVASGESSVLRMPADASKLLALAGASELQYEARLLRDGESVVELPVITAGNAYQGGRTVALDRLFAADSTAANVAVVNLASSRNRCALSLETAEGQRIGPVRSLTLAALETRSFLDLLKDASRMVGPFEARAAVACDGAFYAFALVQDDARATLDLVTPVEAATSVTLADETDPVNILPACPDAAQCFDVAGLAFAPEPPPGLQVGRVWWPAPQGALKRLWMSMDVKVTEWYPKETSGKHLVYWFVINSNPDMAGTLYLRGPAKSEAFVVHGLKANHAAKKRIMVPFEAKVGATYRIVNDYNVNGKDYTVTFTDLETNEVVLVVRGKPNLAAYSIRKKSSFVIDMGFPEGRVPHEVPSWGWEHSNIHIEAFMK